MIPMTSLGLSGDNNENCEKKVIESKPLLRPCMQLLNSPKQNEKRWKYATVCIFFFPV